MKKNNKSMKLELKKFDPSTMYPNSCILMIGKRGVGKSQCMKDILSYHKTIPFSLVISPTETANKFFSDFIPSFLIHDTYEPDLVQKFIDRQKKLTTKKKKEIEQFGTSSIDNRALFVMDDCMYDSKSFANSTEIRNIFFNGRHFQVLYLLTLQHCLGIPPALRTNIDYVFLFRDNFKKNKEKLWDHYVGIIPTFHLFEQIFDQITENYGVMVINNRSSSNRIEDCVFWYKADINKEFKMCDEELWELQAIQDMKEKNNPSTYEEDAIEDNFNPNVLVKNTKNNVKINVKKMI